MLDLLSFRVKETNDTARHFTFILFHEQHCLAKVVN